MSRYSLLILLCSICALVGGGCDDEKCVCAPLDGEARCAYVQDYDTPPEPVHMEAACYPEEARELEEEGSVLIMLGIGTDGYPCTARVDSSDAVASLRLAALEAALKWEFKPAARDGVPVAVEILIPFRFTLN